jgi:16S rRNA (guanine527-N7)-methyltransferase
MSIETTTESASLLAQGIAQLQLAIDHAQQQKMLAYLQLLEKWDSKFNLTAIHGLPQMVIKHLLDSLAAMPYVQGAHCLDVGTGAGLPGVPLAIANPQQQFVLLDSNGKKIRFLQEVKQRLQLTNVELVQSRIQDYRPETPFSDVLCRAFAELSAWLVQAQQVGNADTKYWAWKGQYPAQEIAALPEAASLLNSIELKIPSLAEKRHLLCFSLKQATNKS